MPPLPDAGYGHGWPLEKTISEQEATNCLVDVAEVVKEVKTGSGSTALIVGGDSSPITSSSSLKRMLHVKKF